MSKPDLRKLAEDLKPIGKLIITQDNRITDQPIFIVQERKRDYGYDSEYCGDYVWVLREDTTIEADTKTHDQLEDAADDWDGEAKDSDGDIWFKCYYQDRWQFVTACFTEKACQDFINMNSHHHLETRIYAYGSYRNYEWQKVRKALIAIGEQQ